MPDQNRPFWAEKIQKNVKRDRQVNHILKKNGIEVIRIWEHDLEKETSRVKNVLDILRGKKGNNEV